MGLAGGMAASIEEIRRSVSECTRCGLCKSRRNPVAGSGGDGARAILIGEAPGRSEDIRGEPFVGAAGKKLAAALEHAGIGRGLVYITNVVKCRPPANRIPQDDEIAACRKYLDMEIEAIRPKIICVMGNTACGTLLGGGGITRRRGSIVVRDGRRYLLTVHPAAAIYRPSLLDTLKEDMTTLAGIIGDAR